jgi:deazaflavin-dependent oxidoreductase (nitroreductase family)
MPSGRPYLKPGWLVGRALNPLLMRLGLFPILAVRGRRSGCWQEIPVNLLELDGQRYLVSPRGQTEWVRNLRAAGTGELRRRGRVQPFRAYELPDADKPPIIAAYIEHWGSQVKSQFEALPDPADHPVFRLEPLPA